MKETDLMNCPDCKPFVFNGESGYNLCKKHLLKQKYEEELEFLEYLSKQLISVENMKAIRFEIEERIKQLEENLEK